MLNGYLHLMTQFSYISKSFDKQQTFKQLNKTKNFRSCQVISWSRKSLSFTTDEEFLPCLQNKSYAIFLGHNSACIFKLYFFKIQQNIIFSLKFFLRLFSYRNLFWLIFAVQFSPHPSMLHVSSTYSSLTWQTVHVISGETYNSRS